MTVNSYLDEIAPTTNLWSSIFLRKDNFADLNEQQLEIRERNLFSFCDISRSNTFEVCERLRKRHFELWKFSNCFWANTIFFRIFSPYSLEELKSRREFIIKLLKEIKGDFLADSGLALEVSVPEFFSTTDEELKNGNLRLISTPQGYKTQWYDRSSRKYRQKDTPDLVAFAKIYKACQFFHDIMDYIPEDSPQIVAFVNKISNITMDGVLQGPFGYDVDGKLFIDFEWNYIYKGLNNEFQTGRLDPNEPFTSLQTIIISLEKIGGYAQNIAELNKNFDSFVCDESPGSDEVPLNPFDIRIVIPEHERTHFYVYIPYENSLTRHRIKNGCYDQLKNLIRQQYLNVLKMKGVMIDPSQEKFDIDSPYFPTPRIVSSSSFPIQIVACRLTSFGFMAETLDIPCERFSMEDLDNFLSIKSIAPEEIEVLRKASIAFKDLVISEGLLYDENTILKDQCRIRFINDPLCPLPVIRFVRKDTDEKILTMLFSSPDKSSIILCRLMEDRFKLFNKLRIEDLRNYSYPYFKDCDLSVENENLIMDFKGFTPNAEDTCRYFHTLKDDDTYETLLDTMLVTRRKHIAVLQDRLNETAAETKVQISLGSETPYAKISADGTVDFTFIFGEDVTGSSSYTETASFTAKNDKDFLNIIHAFKNCTAVYRAIKNKVHLLKPGPFIRSKFLKEHQDSGKEISVAFNSKCLSFTAYYCNPLYPNMLLELDLNSRVDIEFIGVSVSEIQTYMLSSKGFLGKLSTFHSVEIPERKDVDIEIIRTYYAQANLTNKKDPNYVNPDIGDMNILSNDTPKLLANFYQNIHDESYSHILDILTNIVFEINNMKDLQEQYLYAMETVAAMCYCPTKHESAFTTVYQTIMGNGAAGNIESYDFIERELGEGDKLKKGAVIEMAGELLDPFDTNNEVAENSQSVHTEKRLINILKNKYRVLFPFAKMQTLRIDQFEMIGNYRADDEVWAGFNNKLNVFRVIHFYHERFKKAFSGESDNHAKASLWTLLLKYVEDRIIPSDDKYVQSSEQLNSIHIEKTRAIHELRETDFDERKRISLELQKETLESGLTTLKLALKEKFKFKDVHNAISSKIKWALNGSKEIDREQVAQECDQALKELTKSHPEESDIILLNTVIKKFIESIKPLTSVWKKYKKQRIDAIESKAAINRNSVFENILEEQGFVAYDDYSTPIEITLKGSIAILTAMEFIELKE